jgi:hypothetical protein
MLLKEFLDGSVRLFVLRTEGYIYNDSNIPLAKINVTLLQAIATSCKAKVFIGHVTQLYVKFICITKNS